MLDRKPHCWLLQNFSYEQQPQYLYRVRNVRYLPTDFKLGNGEEIDKIVQQKYLFVNIVDGRPVVLQWTVSCDMKMYKASKRKLVHDLSNEALDTIIWEGLKRYLISQTSFFLANWLKSYVLLWS